MKKISLTEFVNVVSTAGPSKANKVSEIKNKPPYHPSIDFYKGIREAIIDVVENDEDVSTLNEAVDQAYDKRKGHYEAVAIGFKKWFENNATEWFAPAKGNYSNNSIAVTINPELGLYINETPYLIKLYLKDSKIPKNNALISTHLMKSCLESHSPENTVMAILDVRRGNLIEYKTPHKRINAALRGELAYINLVWDDV